MITVAVAAFWAILAALGVALNLKHKPDASDHEIYDFPPTPEAPKLPVTAPLPQIHQPMPTKNEILYEKAYSLIGHDASPADKAPDSLACAESVNGVYKAAFGTTIGTGPALTSTLALLREMQSDPRFVEVNTPKVGSITIAATGTSTKGASHGHCGIWGNHDVMSNDSDSGLWRSNYTHAAWQQVFHVTLGFPIHYFDLVD